MESVKAMTGLAPWFGGKRNLAKRLVAMIEDVPHTCYAEPFVGMAGVFFRRTRRPKAEIINDRAEDVANVFRVLQRHRGPLIEAVGAFPVIRQELERQLRIDPSTLTDIERAARFLYLQYQRYGGKPLSRSFVFSTYGPPHFRHSRVSRILDALSRRLDGVTIEGLDFEQFLDRYDRPHTLFYLDPPYIGRERDYGPFFDPKDQERLVGTLSRLTGAWILSINDCPRAWELFERWNIQRVDVSYSIAGGKRGGYTELIVTSR